MQHIVRSPIVLAVVPTANSSVTDLIVTFCWSGVAVGEVLVNESEM